MKKLLAFVAATSLATLMFAQDIFSYVPMKGAKKSTQIDYVISAKFGNYFRTPNLKTIRNFDSNGNETDVTEVTTKDALISKIVNSYSVDGFLTEQAAYDAEEALIWKNVINYKNGLKADMSEYGKDDALKSKTIYLYDNNLLVDETGYNGEGKLMWKNVYTYEGSLLTKMSHYDSDGELEESESYTYTDEGSIDSITYFETLDNETTTVVFRYTGSTISELLTYDQNNVLFNRVLVKYDSTGNVVKLSEYNVAQKFGTTVNELCNMTDYVYEY